MNLDDPQAFLSGTSKFSVNGSQLLVSKVSDPRTLEQIYNLEGLSRDVATLGESVFGEAEVS